jgi:proton glutamate symport protein
MALHWKILIALVLGVLAGLFINIVDNRLTPDGVGIWRTLGVGDPAAYLAWQDAPRPAPDAPDPNADAGGRAQLIRVAVNLINFIGDLFLRGLLFVAVPIVLFSLIVGVSSLTDLRRLSRIGGKTVGIYLATTAVAITVGLLLANIVRPGAFVPEATRSALQASMQAAADQRIAVASRPSPWDVVLNIVPRNPFAALAAGEMLQVVFLALILGVALTLIPRNKAEPVVRFCDGVTEAIIRIVYMVMIIAPVAVFALVVRMVAVMGLEVIGALGIYVLVVIAGLAFHMFAFYPLLLRLFTPVTYGRFFRAMLPAQLLAFSSSSSAATLPVTMRCARDRVGVSDEVTSFVVPLGATINMDGTALYQGVAAVFIAQMYNVPLGITGQLAIVLTATAASIGTAGVPGVGTIMLVIVLRSVDIPLEGIAVILGVDRLLDMCRTVVNITGDATVATVVAGTEGALLSEEQLQRVQRE